MMQAIRGRIGSVLVKGLFALLIISFGFWGVSDYFQDRPAPETVVATVGDQSIRVQELQQALQPTLQRLRSQFGGALDDEQLKQFGIVDSLLAQLIERSLLDQEAQRLGLEASDDVIRNTIYQTPAFRGPDGTFDRQTFAQTLMMNRMTEDQLVARLRQDIPSADLVQAITAGVNVPRPVVEVLYRYRNEQRVADIVSVPVSAVSDIAQPSDAELTQFYEANPEMFRAPEYRAFTIASLSPAGLTQTAAIPEDRLRSEYEQRKADLETPERRDIHQILAASEEQAKEALAALRAGTDWSEVATTIAGQDPEAIELGLLTRRDLPEALGEVAFELPLNQPSQPVRSPLGWHIVRVVAIEPGGTPSFAEARARIAADLQLRDAVDRLNTVANQTDDALAAGGRLDEVAAQYGFQLTPVAAVDEGGNDPDGKPVNLPVASDEILRIAFATAEGDTSRVIDLHDGSIFAVQVEKVTPPQVRPLAAVRDRAITAWQTERRREAATKQAEALAASVAPSLPLAQVAANAGLTVREGVKLSRNPSPGQNVPPTLVVKLFAVQPGGVATASDASAAYAAQLREIQTPETIPEAEAARLAEQLTGEARQNVAAEFTDALRRRFPVEIKREELDRIF
jgi:peptidyl-prolyl cis-trans isomerase D